jgi:hypothetical protein
MLLNVYPGVCLFGTLADNSTIGQGYDCIFQVVKVNHGVPESAMSDNSTIS